MNFFSNSLMIITGIYVFIFFIHGILTLKNVNRSTNVWFTLLAFFYVLHNITVFLIHNAVEIHQYVNIARFRMFFTAGAMISLLWFGIKYANYRGKKYAKWVVTGIWIVLPCIRVFHPHLLSYTTIYDIRTINLPWGESISHPTGEPTVFLLIFYLFTLFTLFYTFLIVTQYAQEKYKRKIFTIISFIYVIAFIHDMGIIVFNVNWFPIGHLGSLNMILIVSFSIFNSLITVEKLQKKLKAQQERLNLAIFGTGAGLWDWNLITNQVIINDQYANMLGYKRKEIAPFSFDTWKKLVHPDDLTTATEKVKEHLNGETDRYKIEFRMKTKDNQWIWILGTGKTVEYDKDSKPLRMTGTHVNIDKIKRIELALQKEKDLLRVINYNIPIGIILVSPEGKTLFSNRAFYKITGYTLKEVPTTERWFQLAYPDAEYRKIIADKWAKEALKKDVNISFKILNKGQQYRDIDFHSIILPDNRIVITMEDITEDLRKEEKIREARDLLNTALTQAPVGILIADAPDVNIRVANKTALAINGEDSKKLVNIDVTKHAINWKTYKPNGEMYAPDDLPLSRAILNGEYTAGEEIIMIDNKGYKHWLLVNAAPITDEQKKIIAGIVIFNDITRQKKTEKELAKAKQYIDNIIDSMPSSIIGVNRQLQVTHWNKEAENRTNISMDKAINTKIYQLLPQADKFLKNIKFSISNKETQIIPKLTRKGKNQDIIEDIIIYPLTNNGVEGAVIRIDDITEKVHMEEMMIQSEKMLSIGGLAAGMAHEINNPLAGMMQNAAVLLNRLTKESPKNLTTAEKVGIDFYKLKKFMQQRNIIRQLKLINESGKRASGLVSNMLSFARKSESKLKATDVSQLLDNTIALVKNDYDMKKHYDFKKIKIQREYPQSVPEIYCEETKLQQVFMNILKNGAEAMVADKKETIDPRFILRVIELPNRIQIQIENNGPSIPPTIQKRIFEPFYTTKGIGRGTGLGLSVSYFIITKNHNGAMWVESNEEKHPRFVLELPYDLNKQGK